MRRLAPIHSPSIWRRARPIVNNVLLGLFALVFGVIIGLSAVLLPPSGPFGLVGVFGLFLFWAMPDDARLVPSTLFVRRVLMVAIGVNLCVPTYYAISLPGSPWISFRRLILFPMTFIVLVAVSTSPEMRAHVVATLRRSKIASTLAATYFVAALLSVFFSHALGTSMSRFVNMIIEWYLPALAVLMTVRSARDFDRMFSLISYCSIFISLLGLADFIKKTNILLDIMPGWMLNGLMETNPATVEMLKSGLSLRNGLYRAASVYTVPLSFSEFCGLMFPFSLFFMAYGPSPSRRLFGGFMMVCLIAGVFSSGSRGGYLMILTALPIFLLLWCVKYIRTSSRSLAPAIIGSVALPALLTIFAAVIFWPRAHNVVFGGGMEQYSTNARFEEWTAAIPHILERPLFGNGFAIGAEVVGIRYFATAVPTLDSSLISVLVETGIVGFVSFFGMIVAAIVISVVEFLRSPAPVADWYAPLAAGVTGFLVYRMALSQVDNHFIFFVFIAAILTLRTLASPGGSVAGREAANAVAKIR